MKRWYRSGLCTALAFSMLAIPAPVLAVETNPPAITQSAPDEDDYRVEIVELNETDFVVISYYKDQVKSKTYGSKGGKTIRIVTYLDENNQPLAQPREEIRNVADTIVPVFPVTTYEGTVYAEGQPVVCLNEAGKKVPILVHQGTTYIPIRTAGEWMGKNVAWDDETRTVRLTGTTEKTFYNRFDEAETPAAITTTENDRMELDSGIAVTLDGKEQVFKNVKGEEVYPMVLNGTTYLPLRSIGELTGMEVLWSPAGENNGNHSHIFMRTSLSDAQKQEVETYLTQQNAWMGKIVAPLKARRTSKDADQAAADWKSVKNILLEMSEAKMPSASMAKFSYTRYQKEITKAINTANAITEKSSAEEIHRAATEIQDSCVQAIGWLGVMQTAYCQDNGKNDIQTVTF